MPVLSSVSAAANALKGISTFMLSFIPVFAVITAASGSGGNLRLNERAAAYGGSGRFLYIKLCNNAAYGRIYGGKHKRLCFSAA